MARLQKIFEVINSKVPSYNSAFTKVRGLSIPVDTILRGKLRFAKKIGFPIPIWLPDNLTTTSQDATVINNFLYLNLPLTWAVPGAIVRISDHFLMTIDDITDDSLRLLFTNTLPVNVDSGSNVELFAAPIEVVGTYAAPINTVVVKSSYRIYVGDDILFKTFSYKIITSTFVGTLPNGRYEYQLTLAMPVLESLYDGRSDQLYLRTYPAYESEKIVIPTIPHTDMSDNDIGPFLYDRISGVFYTDADVEEIDNITLYDQLQIVTDVINGCGKNFVVNKKSIWADMFLFWDLLRGHLNWNNLASTFKATTDDDGVFQLHYKCVPTINPGQITGWTVRVTPTVNTRMAVELEPNVSQVWDLIGGVETTVTVAFPITDVPIEHFHIIFKDVVGNSVVYLSNFDLIVEQMKYFSYTTIVKAVGETWASSPALVKPYFLRLGYIIANSDLHSALDAGLIVG